MPTLQHIIGPVGKPAQSDEYSSTHAHIQIMHTNTQTRSKKHSYMHTRGTETQEVPANMHSHIHKSKKCTQICGPLTLLTAFHPEDKSRQIDDAAKRNHCALKLTHIVQCGNDPGEEQLWRTLSDGDAMALASPAHAWHKIQYQLIMQSAIASAVANFFPSNCGVINRKVAKGKEKGERRAHTLALLPS